MSSDYYWREKVVSWKNVGLTYMILVLAVALVVSVELIRHSAAPAGSEGDYGSVGSRTHKPDAYSYLSEKELDLLRCPLCR